MGLTSSEAAHRAKMLDRERTLFLKDHFHIDPTCPENYDLTINMSLVPVDGAAEIIRAALAAREQVRRQMLRELQGQHRGLAFAG